MADHKTQGPCAHCGYEENKPSRSLLFQEMKQEILTTLNLRWDHYVRQYESGKLKGNPSVEEFWESYLLHYTDSEGNIIPNS